MFKPHYCFPDSHQLSTTWPAFDPSAQRSPSIHLICSAEARFSPQQTAEIPTCVLLWWESKNGDRDVFVRDNRKLMCKKCWESFHVWPLPFWGAEKNADTPRVLRGRHVGLGWPTRINNRVFDQWHPGVQESGSIGSFGGRQIRGKIKSSTLAGRWGKVYDHKTALIRDFSNMFPLAVKRCTVISGDYRTNTPKLMGATSS